ncbi:hypothetical protein AM228_07730 [Planktothricoides sp. SR001]|nr:hypothetical protein AM228_07730 [Planktothricoides sp. SR001]
MPGSGVSIPPKIVNRKNRLDFILYNRYVIIYNNKTRLDIIGLKIDLVVIDTWEGDRSLRGQFFQERIRKELGDN